MTNHLTVIRGAGFSANAGMPTANGIAERFNRDLRQKLLSFSSSEWTWIDGKSDVEKNNGVLNFDYLAYSYVFNQLVQSYVEDRGSFIYYEDFYQYIIDNFKDADWVENLFLIARKALVADKPYLEDNDYSKNYLFAFDHKQFSKVSSILNYLIGDILAVFPTSDSNLIDIYKGFIKYISSFDEVDIFTLNHDLLLEHVLDINGLNYSKGFSVGNSPIANNNVAIPFFNNEFDAKIRVHKLHGSLDFYQFRHYLKDGLWWQPTSKVDYYLTTNYYTKHNAQLIDPTTKEILQDYNFDIVPKFITGTKKTETIQNDFLYKELFENFEKTIAKSENLFISGYSFSDEHINGGMEAKAHNFINHNRNKDYPYAGIGKNIRNLDELL